LTALRWLEDRRLEHALVLLLFLALTLIFFWPLPAHLASGISGDPGDPFLNARLIAWDADTLVKNPTNLFNVNFFHPSRDVLTFSEHLITLGVLGIPLFHLTKNAAFTYNILSILGYVFSGFGCYLLIKYLTGSRWGALVGGLFFAFCPFKMGQLTHIHVAFSPFLPLILLHFFRYMRGGAGKDLALLAILLLLQSLVGWHYALFCILTVALCWITLSPGPGRDRWSKALRSAAVVLGVIAVLALFSLPYLTVRSRFPDYRRTVEEAAGLAVSLRNFIQVPGENVLYGRILGLGVDRGTYSEKMQFPGLLTPFLVLTGISLLVRRRKQGVALSDPTRRYILFFALLVMASLAYAIGPRPGGVTNPIYFLTFLGNRLGFIRVPARFYVLTVLGIAVLAGYGLASLLHHLRPKHKPARLRTVAACLVAFQVFELFTLGVPVVRSGVSQDLKEAYLWLKEKRPATVLELPVSAMSNIILPNSERMGFVPHDAREYIERECAAIFNSVMHGCDLVNGYSGYCPPTYRKVLAETLSFPSPRSVDILAGLRVDYVLWHWEWLDEEERPLYRKRLESAEGLILERDLGDLAIYRISPRPTAEESELQTRLVLPERVPSGEGFNLGITVTNPSRQPYLCADEEQQLFKIEFKAPDGSTVHSEDGSFRPLFFLEGSESASLSLTTRKSPPPGDYLVELRIEKGAFAGRVLTAPISVVPREEAIGSGLVNGKVSLPEGSPAELAIPSLDGLYPVDVVVHNTGENLWKSRWDRERAEEYPYGLVYVAASWYRDGERTWDSQAEALPCDLSGGQSVTVATLVRPPRECGRYLLKFWLFDELHGGFGEACAVEVEIKDASCEP